MVGVPAGVMVCLVVTTPGSVTERTGRSIVCASAGQSKKEQGKRFHAGFLIFIHAPDRIRSTRRLTSLR